MNPKLNYKHLFEQLPESDLWQLLQGVIASEFALDDDVIERLDDRMQGCLFLQESVVNRKARIAFARSSGHMLYLRDADNSPESLWLSDLSLKSVDGKTLHDRLVAAGLSTGRPIGASGAAAESIH